MLLISYVRVSTVRQGQSGLGLEAQQDAVARYAASVNGNVLSEYCEVESGRRNDRPQLAAALRACRRMGARLVVAKLDRLSRNVAFIATLMESGVDFVACDLPVATPLLLHVLAAVAEAERAAISERVKAALRAARARGTILGRPENLTMNGASQGRLASAKARAAQANTFAERTKSDIRELGLEGKSLAHIAAGLNAERVKGARGDVGTWTATAVRRVMRRANGNNSHQCG